ncbi:MAG TPA: glutamate--tRNA ligase [Agriterribacter sp.]|nr:glutamate--tRNA ligase [Agriterribacter sp.]
MPATKKVRVRFAPSPTGGLHLGGVRTVLYNYLFAKQFQGSFILRIEDTDQSRYVTGAEEYIFNCLKWVGLEPDESPVHGGAYGPYRQSERKTRYRQYAEQLVKDGYAYYAFDTPEALEKMRTDFKTDQNPSPQYDHTVRTHMRNSLTLAESEVQKLLDENTRHVIRIKMPENETVRFTDMIRGDVSFNTSVVDDKVLLKADGMPTYHLAVVVDDHLMEISHVFRGEEWLPSAPVHILLWKYLFGADAIPQWAHLPNGKLSKRDGAKYGFPVFAMNWTDPQTHVLTEGFKEKGFLPEAFINLLAVLGWNDGTGQEIFTKAELIEKFSIERVHSAGAKFDYEKAKWFNHEWIKRLQVSGLREQVKQVFTDKGINVTDEQLLSKVIALVKERCHLLTDFAEQGAFFFKAPGQYDMAAVKPKWNEAKQVFFAELIRHFELSNTWDADDIETGFKEMTAAHQIKPGELLLPFRIMLVGGKFGPGVFHIAGLLGKEETVARIKRFLAALQEKEA